MTQIFKQILLRLPDGSNVVLDKETSEAIHVLAEAKKITIEQAIDEVFQNLIRMKKENEFNG